MFTKRDYGLFVTTGLQGVGKTYYNIDMALGYRLDNPQTGRQGKKVLIYNSSLDASYRHIPILRWADVKNQPDRTVYQVQARKSNGEVFTPSEKKQWLFYLFQNFSDGLLILEDFSNCVLNTTAEEFVGPLTTMRHKKRDMYADSGTDVLVSTQDMSFITGQMWKNISYYRFHKQLGTVESQKGDMANYFLYEIAENIINKQFQLAEDGKRCNPPLWQTEAQYKAQRSYHVWIRAKDIAISGCRQDTFITGAAEYILNGHNVISSFCRKNGLNPNNSEHAGQALEALIKPYYNHYINDRMPPWQLYPTSIAG